MSITNAHGLAVLFHQTYERMAPDFGYETRMETREFDASTPNGQLMIAVCESVLKDILEYLTNTYLHGMREFHPRAFKLLQKRQPFIVIADDESYYLAAYSMIRADRKAKGEWSDLDEAVYMAQEFLIQKKKGPDSAGLAAQAVHSANNKAE